MDSAPPGDTALRAAAVATRPARESAGRVALQCLGIALASAAIVTCFLAPRFVLWRGLALADDLPDPAAEFDRAVPSLEQVKDPWAPVKNHIHRVIAWRLLFPVIWHYLHLPIWLYLATPQIGCVLVLWLVAWLTYLRTWQWGPTWVATMLLAALPWFFVSSSWLLHFDSWLLLGVFAAAFVPSRLSLALVCLLTPWVDARFVLALPVTLAVRAVTLQQIELRRWRDMIGDLAVATLATLPYLGIRAIAWSQSDPDSTNYVQSHWAELQTIHWTRLAFGLWSGYRAAWPVVIAAMVLAAPRIGWRWGLVFAALVVGTALGSLVIAWDMSRSLMMIGPVLLLGIWLCYEWQSTIASWVMPTVVVANLLVPAYHVLWSVDWPVESLIAEIRKWRGPPNVFAAVEHVRQARQLIQENRLAEAREYFDLAIQTEGNYPQAFVERALLRLHEGDAAGAEADVEDAIRLRADYPYAFLLRGILRAGRSDVSGAVSDFEHALQIAPSNWPYREQTEQMIAEAQKKAAVAKPVATP